MLILSAAQTVLVSPKHFRPKMRSSFMLILGDFNAKVAIVWTYFWRKMRVQVQARIKHFVLVLYGIGESPSGWFQQPSASNLEPWWRLLQCFRDVQAENDEETPSEAGDSDPSTALVRCTLGNETAHFRNEKWQNTSVGAHFCILKRRRLWAVCARILFATQTDTFRWK